MDQKANNPNHYRQWRIRCSSTRRLDRCQPRHPPSRHQKPQQRTHAKQHRGIHERIRNHANHPTRKHSQCLRSCLGKLLNHDHHGIGTFAKSFGVLERTQLEEHLERANLDQFRDPNLFRNAIFRKSTFISPGFGREKYFGLFQTFSQNLGFWSIQSFGSW